MLIEGWFKKFVPVPWSNFFLKVNLTNVWEHIWDDDFVNVLEDISNDSILPDVAKLLRFL